jgi:AraC-like DNA-binding protein
MDNIEFKFFNDFINKVQFKILEHGYLKAGSDWKFMQLSSPFNRLYFVLKGTAGIHCGSEHIRLEPGKMYLIPLNNTCDYICSNILNKFYIHFRLEFIPGHDLFEGYKPCEGLPFEEYLVRELIDSGRQGDINGLLNCKGILLSCISRFIQENSEHLQEQIKLSSKYEKLYGYIMNNCNAELRVTEIARYMNLPLVNLSKNFKNDMGTTLKKFLDGKIIQKAEEMLLVTDKAVKEIAFELKFSDEFHFSRFFKRYTGLSPSLYRQRNNTFK